MQVSKAETARTADLALTGAPWHGSTMSVVGHGLDIVEVAHFAKLCTDPAGGDMLARYFTLAELDLVGSGPNRAQRLAGRFAAKEAVLKAMGTGWTQGIAWTDVEIQALATGAPTVALYARAAELAAERGIVSWLVSISHLTTFAVASAIAISDPRG